MGLSILVVPLLAASQTVLPSDRPLALPAPATASVSVEQEEGGQAGDATDQALPAADQADPEAPADAPVAPSPPGNGTEIVVAAHRATPGDPVQALNAASFEAVQAVDRAIIGPVAKAYMSTVPKPIQSGLHNVLDNLDEPIVFLNFLLQLKPGKAVETLGRFAINSTLGVAGLIDVAKRRPFKLPRRSNGLADTLGYYGVGPGPYLFLPVIGSTTVRDLVARPFDLLILPAAIGNPFNRPDVSLAKGALSALDERANFDEQLHKLRDESADPYAAVRDYYLSRRRAEIDVLRGKRASVDNPEVDVSKPPSTGEALVHPVPAP